jgi:hypothetical protein
MISTLSAAHFLKSHQLLVQKFAADRDRQRFSFKPFRAILIQALSRDNSLGMPKRTDSRCSVSVHHGKRARTAHPIPPADEERKPGHVLLRKPNECAAAPFQASKAARIVNALICFGVSRTLRRARYAASPARSPYQSSIEGVRCARQ